MARPPKNAIHEAAYQIKDFFNDESMKRQYPKNPYNVLWFMQELIEPDQLKSPQWISFKEYLLNCLKNNETVSPSLNPLKEKMIEDDLVIKRVANIVELSQIDINSLGLATKGVRMKSAPLIQGLIDLGLNPNTPDEINLPLEVALNRKNLKIANLYWNHPLMNRLALNKEGENFAEIAIKYKQWKFFETILQDEPQLIFGKKENGQLNVENIIALFNEQKYIPNERDLEIKEEREAKNRKYNVVLVPDRVRQILKELMSFCNTQNGNVDISNPEVKNLWKEAMYNNFSEKFNHNPNMEKSKTKKI